MKKAREYLCCVLRTTCCVKVEEQRLDGPRPPASDLLHVVGFLAPVRSALAEQRHSRAVAVRAFRPPAKAQAGRGDALTAVQQVSGPAGPGSAAIHGVWKVAGARWVEKSASAATAASAKQPWPVSRVANLAGLKPGLAEARRRRAKAGGERGIRTPGPLSRSTVFKTAALNHSAISPAGHGRRKRLRPHQPV